MPLLLNGAGASAADPILKNLGLGLVFFASSLDVATVNGAWIDQASGFPGTNTVASSLSPASSVITAGTAGGYNDTTKQYTVSDTTGLSAGDPLFLSHAAITDGIFEIASIVNGTDVTVQNNPLDGSGAQTNIAYQVGWRYDGAAGTAPMASSAGGTQNWFKAETETAATVVTQYEDTFFVRDAPAGSAFIAVDGGDYTGQIGASNALTLAILSGWTNQGGVVSVEMANHSVQTANDFTWTSGGGTGEVALATAESGLTASAGDGAKYGRLLFRGLTGSAYTVGVDIDYTVDSAGSVLSMTLWGA